MKRQPEFLIPRIAIAGATRAQRRLIHEVALAHSWLVIVRDGDGRVKDIDGILSNLVVTEGRNKYLDATLKTGLASPAWYLGLTDGTPSAAAGDTLASHAGWSEVTAYDEAARQAWTAGAISAGSVDNSGSPAVFTISANSTTVGGAFMADDNTKGGSSGTLLSIGAFTGGDKALDDNDTLTVTLTASMTAS